MKTANKDKDEAVKAEADKTNKVAEGVAAKEKLIRELDAKIKDMRDRFEQNEQAGSEHSGPRQTDPDQLADRENGPLG